MTTAREIMTPNPVCVRSSETVYDAAQRMAELGVGALHQVRRLPVIDRYTLVGIVAQADVARSVKNPRLGDLVEALSVDY